MTINEIIKKYALKPYRYVKNKGVTFIDTDDGRFVIKKKKGNNEVFDYLNSRSFNYYPNIISDSNDEYEVMEYVEDIDTPLEQKIIDMIDLVSLLHNKTTYFEEVNEDSYKELYEDIRNNIEYLYGYYNDLITPIENQVYMGPSEYLLIRNISEIYMALGYCKTEIEVWYKLVKDSHKQRKVVLHNNLEIDHFIKNESSYLLSWDKSKRDIPIFDLYKLYKKHSLDVDFGEVLKRYESGYPLLEDERKLFFILIALPNKIDLNGKTYEVTKKISKEIDILYKTDMLISPYYKKD